MNLKDSFDEVKKHHVVLNQTFTVAKRRRWLSDGGLVYVKRQVDPT